MPVRTTFTPAATSPATNCSCIAGDVVRPSRPTAAREPPARRGGNLGVAGAGVDAQNCLRAGLVTRMDRRGLGRAAALTAGVHFLGSLPQPPADPGDGERGEQLDHYANAVMRRGASPARAVPKRPSSHA